MTDTDESEFKSVGEGREQERTREAPRQAAAVAFAGSS